MRKGIRIVLDDATQYAVTDLARRQSRPLANAAAYLIKLGLEQIRAQATEKPPHLYTLEQRMSSAEKSRSDDRSS